jgi:DnaK suppressor protein
MENVTSIFSLRSYKGYNLVDAGSVENGDPGDCKLEIQTQTNDLHDVKHTIFFNNSQPENINKAIERAKEWINSLEPKADEVQSTTARYSDSELVEFKLNVESKLNIAIAESGQLSDRLGEALDKESRARVQGLVDRQEKFIDQLHAAIDRIDAKTYGVCRVTGKLIEKERLFAVPHATLSNEGKGQATVQKSEAKPSKEKKPRVKKEKGTVKLQDSENSESGDLQSDNNAKEKSTVIVQEKIRTCRVCGCTDNNCQQCVEKTGSACHWVEQDLCSACMEEPEIEVKDQRASTVTEEKPVEPEFIPQASNFFQQLSSFGKVDLTLRIMQVGEKLQVGIFPHGKATQVPINMTGTAEDLDNNFFSDVSKVKDVPGYITNIEVVKKAATDKKEKAVTSSNKPSLSKKKKPAARSKPQPKKSKPKPPVKKSPAPRLSNRKVKPKPAVSQTALDLPKEDIKTKVTPENIEQSSTT